jgi:hypothetical protein
MSVHVVAYGPRKAPNMVNADITISTLGDLPARIQELPADSYIFLCAKDGRYPDYYVSRLKELNQAVSGCGGIQILFNREALLEYEFMELTGNSGQLPDRYRLANTVNTQAVHILDIAHGILFRRDTIGADFKVYVNLAGDCAWESLLLSNYWARHNINRINLCIPAMNRFFMDAMRMVKQVVPTAGELERGMERLKSMNILHIKIE